MDLTDRVIALRSITEIHPDEANKNAALAEQLKVRAETEDQQSPSSYHLGKRDAVLFTERTSGGLRGQGGTCIRGSALISPAFHPLPTWEIASQLFTGCQLSTTHSYYRGKLTPSPG